MTWEANRPGLLLPGATGLTAVLVALASVARGPQPERTLFLLVIAFAAMLACFRRPLPWLQVATAALWFAAFLSVQQTLLSLTCCCLLVLVTSWCARIAYLARRNKGHR